MIPIHIPHRATPWLILLTLALLTAACVPAAYPVSPNELNPYVFVTANSEPTRTPFQPSNGTQATATLMPAPPTFTPTAIPPSPTLPPRPTTPPTAIPTPAPTKAPINSGGRTSYAITLLVDYDGHTAAVSEDVYYTNRTSAALENIVLAVNPNLWNGVFALQSLTLNDKKADYDLGGQWLTITPEEALQPGKTVKIGIGYSLALPYSSSKLENFGYTGRQTNLTDWFPFVPPYQGGWVLPDPWAFGENLVYESADFRISLIFSDPASAPVVAASAPGVVNGNTTTYSLANARTFAFSMSRDFLTSSTQSSAGATITSFYFPEHATAGQGILEFTRQAVDTYSTSFGPYRHNYLAVVETDLNDGLESDGLYFLARSFYASYDGTVANNLAVIGIHETAHQWWFGGVASNQAEEPWLDEALSAYSEYVFFSTNYPGLLNWWWNWRVNSYEPTGYVDTRIYNGGTFRGYVNAVYLQGANFLDELRLRIGDEAFFAFLRDYYTRHEGQVVTSDDFFNTLAAHTSIDYSDIVDAYFRNR